MDNIKIKRNRGMKNLRRIWGQKTKNNKTAPGRIRTPGLKVRNLSLFMAHQGFKGFEVSRLSYRRTKARINARYLNIILISGVYGRSYSAFQGKQEGKKPKPDGCQCGWRRF